MSLETWLTICRVALYSGTALVAAGTIGTSILASKLDKVKDRKIDSLLEGNGCLEEGNRDLLRQPHPRTSRPSPPAGIRPIREMPGGGQATMMLTLGYDPAKGCFVGTWVGSMMTHLWVYDGFLDETGKVLTLEAEGPDMSGAGGKMAKYRDVITMESDDHRVLTSHMLGVDGKWQPFMTAHYRRRK